MAKKMARYPWRVCKHLNLLFFGLGLLQVNLISIIFIFLIIRVHLVVSCLSKEIVNGLGEDLIADVKAELKGHEG